MKMNESDVDHPAWRIGITNLDAKEKVARQMAARLHDGDVVGVGSGSTSLARSPRAGSPMRMRRDWQFARHHDLDRVRDGLRRHYVPNLEPSSSFAPIGHSTVPTKLTPRRNMIKGRGGAMLREKLIIASSPERYVLVDESKLVEQLGLRFPIPLELVPESLQLVRSELLEHFEVREMELRMAVGKDGPVITENRNLILDVRFARVTPDLDPRLNSVPGIVGTGLFVDFHPTVISA